MNKPWQSTKQLRALLIALLVAGAALFQFLPFAGFLNAFGLDFLLPFASAPEKPTSENSPIVLVVIDEVTHNTAPFSETPHVAWTPYLAQALDKVSAAGAVVIGFDIIFPKTLSGPDLLPGYDRPFLQSLYTIGRSGRLILGEARLSNDPIEPYEGQIQAIGGRQNIVPVHLTPDSDGVVRRYPASFVLENGETTDSFANALVARAGHEPRNEPFMIDFTPPQRIPAYRLTDLLACNSGQSGQLEKIFQGRIVIFGTALDIEDRHMAGNRFVSNTGLEINQDLCNAPFTQNASPNIDRQSVPGVLLHALAAQTILSGHEPKPLSATLNLGIAMMITFLLSLGTLHWRPLVGLGLLMGTLGLFWGAALYALVHYMLIPYLNWGALSLVSYFALTTYRVAYEDQQKRWIRNAFSHYLSPALVDKLSSNPALLKLGGERRHVAVMFLDLADFTSLSEEMSGEPEQLVDLLNDILARFSAVIETHEGYIDKYVGDAVMAVWGAPVDCAHPEAHAVQAALGCEAAFDDFHATQKQNRTTTIKGLRIGLHSGPAIAGNIGSKARFDYTLIGDTVNLAARLEALNKKYGTVILASEDFVSHLSSQIETRYIEETQVPGRVEKVKLYEITA